METCMQRIRLLQLFTPNADQETNRELLEKILDKVERIERRQDLMFGNVYLINGKFVDIKGIHGNA